MTHPALKQLFEDDFQETIEAIATPLRFVSPHVAEMVHSQLLSDVATICESISLLIQGPAQKAHGTDIFISYVQRRRDVGFNDMELHAIIATCKQELLKSLASLNHEDGQDTVRQQLEETAHLLDTLITSVH
jgi:hypothetical protein